jgi:RNA polymerase sigma factor (sigma-70 family)
MAVAAFGKMVETGMDQEATTIAIQKYLDGMAGDTPADPIIQALLDRSARRLFKLCTSLLHRSYPRLARPPLNLDADELLGALVERLLKALREARPKDVRQFFALANQHIRWELNDLARRLDERPKLVDLGERQLVAPDSSDTGLTPVCRRMFEAISRLPDAEREAFELVRLQGMNQAEAARILGVSAMTVKRRLNRGLQFLSEELSDLQPNDWT